jgi:2-dehydro-3-deoxygalactonokinase
MTPPGRTPMDTPRLLALDWGSSNLRASLLGPAGQVLHARSSPQGVMNVPPGGFETVLRALCGDWLDQVPGLPLIASGMVGSRQGWQEAPYLALPAGPAQAAAALTPVDLHTHRLHIVPGVRDEPYPGRHDVMRGEETQVWGSLQVGTAGWCVLPGTHSKWVLSDAQGRVTRLRTYMTGELYALLAQHGTPGRLMVHGQRDDDAFDAGVALGAREHAQATHALFAARTAGLLGGLAATSLPDHLSGLLIGMEAASALAMLPPAERTAPLLLVGDDSLCTHYARALELLGTPCRTAPPGATERGLWQVARAAELTRE